MTVIAGAVVVLAFFIVGVLVGTSLAHHWMSRRIHSVGTERRDLFEQRAEVVDAWTDLAAQRSELDLMRRTIESGS